MGMAARINKLGTSLVEIHFDDVTDDLTEVKFLDVSSGGAEITIKDAGWSWTVSSTTVQNIPIPSGHKFADGMSFVARSI